MPFKRWNIPLENNAAADSLALNCQIDKIIARILYNKGYTSVDQITSFVEEIMELESPFSLPDMQEAVNRIRLAIDNFERICIYGDYDCDGVTSTALLYIYLESVGADVMFLLPTREEGYGLNNNSIDKLSKQEVSLIITVDNGISAINEIDYATSLGIDVIVTDHHQPSETLPNAIAVVDPHIKGYNLNFRPFAGVGVAFKLVTALEDGNYDSTLEQFADILAIGTIGDIVPLYGENRLFVKRGLALLPYTDNLGIKALIEASAVKNLTSRSIAFGIVPKINAVGRMATANTAVKLLICDDAEEAAELAQETVLLNAKRQETEKVILEQIYDIINKNPNILNDRVLFFKGEDFDAGIIGIVASKLVDKYSKPVFVMSQKNGEITGSARSVGEFNLFKVLSECEKLLIKFGGHKLAAGFNLSQDNYDEFCKMIQEYALQNFDIMPQAEFIPDVILNEDEITVQTAQKLEILEPFGQKNEAPLFLIKNAKIIAVTPLSQNKHIKIKVCVGTTTFECLYFGITTLTFGYNISDVIDMLVNLETNEFNNNLSLSVKVKDVRLSGFNEKAFFNAKGYYEKIKRGEKVSNKVLQIATPNRDEIAIVYKYIRQIKIYENDIDMLYCAFLKHGLNYCKFRLILDILKKVDINTAKTMMQLHNN
ncbi:MAG: single-stranded-DNA-specific exonuclease RecJ [Oscillospiraceae bacterium]